MDLGKRLTRAVRIMLRDGGRCGRGVGAGAESRRAGEAAGERGRRVAGTARRSPEAEGAGGRVGRRVCATGDRRRTPFVFFFQAEDGIRDLTVTGVQTCALPI